MGIRKIKARTAWVEGEYIFIEDHYQWTPWGAVIGFALGMVGILYAGHSVPILPALLILSVSSMMGFILIRRRVSRQIPNVDLVEIKSYLYHTIPKHVTVVLDDERTKRKQAVAVSPKK